MRSREFFVLAILVGLAYEAVTCGKGSPEWTRTTNPASQDPQFRSGPMVAQLPSVVGLLARLRLLWTLVASLPSASFGMDKAWVRSCATRDRRPASRAFGSCSAGCSGTVM